MGKIGFGITLEREGIYWERKKYLDDERVCLTGWLRVWLARSLTSRRLFIGSLSDGKLFFWKIIAVAFPLSLAQRVISLIIIINDNLSVFFSSPLLLLLLFLPSFDDVFVDRSISSFSLYSVIWCWMKASVLSILNILDILSSLSLSLYHQLQSCRKIQSLISCSHEREKEKEKYFFEWRLFIKQQASHS